MYQNMYDLADGTEYPNFKVSCLLSKHYPDEYLINLPINSKPNLILVWENWVGNTPCDRGKLTKVRNILRTGQNIAGIGVITNGRRTEAIMKV